MRVTQMNAFPSQKITERVVSAPVNTVRQPAVQKSPLTQNLGRILSGFEKDDYILIGIIAVLIFEGCDDYILLAALGYLFFMGIK